MTDPFDRPELPGPRQAPPGPAFAGSFRQPRVLRLGVVIAATLVLLVSAALTLGASPTPSGAAPGGAAKPEQSEQPEGFGRGFGFFGPDAAGPGAGGAPNAVPGDPNAGPDLGGLGLGRRRFGAGFPGRGIGRQITVASIEGSNLSLKTDDGWTRTIAVTTSTKITRSGATIALGDIKVGDAIRFRETRKADGSFAIDAIDVLVPRIVGPVTGVTDSTFTVKAGDGTSWTVTVNSSTKYTLGGKAGAKSDVAVGVIVDVLGSRDSDSTMTATAVRVELRRVIGRVTAKTGDTITVQGLGGKTQTIHVSGSTSYRIPGVATPSLSDVTVGSILGAAGKQRADGSLDATIVEAARNGVRWFGGRGPNGGAPKGGQDPNGAVPSGSPDASAKPASVG